MEQRILKLTEERNSKYNEDISHYKSIIASLEDQIRISNERFRGECTRYEARIASLEGELRDLRASMQGSEGDLLRLREAIMRLEGELGEVRRLVGLKEQENIELNHKWQQEVERNRSLLASCAYTIEFLRSVLIALETLLGEQDAAFNSVEHAQRAQIGLGLEECTRWQESVVVV